MPSLRLFRGRVLNANNEADPRLIENSVKKPFVILTVIMDVGYSIFPMATCASPIAAGSARISRDARCAEPRARRTVCGAHR